MYASLPILNKYFLHELPTTAEQIEIHVLDWKVSKECIWAYPYLILNVLEGRKELQLYVLWHSLLPLLSTLYPLIVCYSTTRCKNKWIHCLHIHTKYVICMLPASRGDLQQTYRKSNKSCIRRMQWNKSELAACWPHENVFILCFESFRIFLFQKIIVCD